MRLLHVRSQQLGVIAAATLGGMALFFTVVPTRGQQGAPTAVQIRVSRVMPVAKHTRHGVTLDYSLPPGFKRTLLPRVRVTDGRGRLLELLPMYILPRGLGGTCYCELQTGNYPFDTAEVTIVGEIDYQDTANRSARAVSAGMRLSLPGRG